MDSLGEQRLADTCLSDDHKGLRLGGEVLDSRPESCDGRAAAYDSEGIQSCGPDERDHMDVTGSNRFERNGSSRRMVSGLRRSLDSGLDFQKRKCVQDVLLSAVTRESGAAKMAGCCEGYLLGLRCRVLDLMMWGQDKEWNV